MSALPVWVSVLVGMIAGICVVLLHVAAGYALVHRSIRWRVTARVLASVLVLAGLVVGAYVAQALTTGAIVAEADASVPGLCR